MSQKTLSTELFDRALSEHMNVMEQVRQQGGQVASIAEEMIAALRDGGKVLWCGNGGSASDAQHLAAELVGRFKRNRRGLPSIALTTDTSILTAVANDFGYDRVFQRQVEALCRPEDVVVGISTSGNSASVCAALEEAQRIGATTVAFTGQGGGALASSADYLLDIPSRETARVQEAHILCGHVICDLIETAFFAPGDLDGTAAE